MKHRIIATGLAMALVVGMSACGENNQEPSPAKSSTTSQQTTSRAVKISVEGTGIATDVTVLIIDPDTGLKPSDGATGTDDKAAAPTDTEHKVGDSEALTDSQKNVQLPFHMERTLKEGQEITVSAQNGTSGGQITVTIETNGRTVTKSATGPNAAVTATTKESK